MEIQKILSAMKLYAPADWYLLRVPLQPIQMYQNLASQQDEACVEEQWDEEIQRCYELLMRYASLPEVRQALLLASPPLFEALERLYKGELSLARQQQVCSAVLRYLIRMSTRATP